MRKNFSSWGKTDSQYHACLTKKSNWSRVYGNTKIPISLAKEFHSAYHIHMCLKKQSAIQVSKNSLISSKFKLPRARIFHQERKQTMQTMHALQNNTIDQEYLDKLKIHSASSKTVPSQKKIDSVTHVCLTKQSNYNSSRIFGQPQHSKCHNQKKYITK